MKRFILRYKEEGESPLYLYEDEAAIVLTERADEAVRMELADCITFIAKLPEHRERWTIMKLETTEITRVTPFSKNAIRSEVL